MSFDYQANGEVVDTPIEGGSFTSYNKTIKPLTITLETIFQGSAYWQAAILLELRVMQQTATRLVLVTPSGVYVDMALATILFKREKGNGSELLQVKLVLKEVMDVDSWFSVRNVIRRITDKMAKKVDAVSGIDVGMVQTQTVSASEFTRLAGNA